MLKILFSLMIILSSCSDYVDLFLYEKEDKFNAYISRLDQKKFTENFWNIKPKNNYLSKISLFDEKDIKKTKIRIGYFSGDFTNHAVFHLIQDLILNHNKSKFEIFAYSTFYS